MRRPASEEPSRGRGSRVPGAGHGGGRKRGSPSAAGSRGAHPEALGPLAGGAWLRLGACARSVGGRGAQGRDAARPGRPAARDALGPPATPRGMVSPGRPLPAGTRQAASLLRLGLLLLPPLLRGSGAQKGERAGGRGRETGPAWLHGRERAATCAPPPARGPASQRRAPSRGRSPVPSSLSQRAGAAQGCRPSSGGGNAGLRAQLPRFSSAGVSRVVRAGGQSAVLAAKIN